MPSMNRRAAIGLVAAAAATVATQPAVSAPANVPVIWDGKKMWETFSKDGQGFSAPGPKGRKIAYCTIDTQCPDCIRLMERIEPLYSKVEVIWCPIANLNIHSDAQGALILMDKNPFAKLMEHHDNFRNPDFRGLRYDITKIPDEQRNRVWINTKMARRCGCRAVPFGVFKNSKGEYVGFDENLLTNELAELFEVTL